MMKAVRPSARLLAACLSAGLLIIPSGAHAVTPVQPDKLDATLSAVAKNGASKPALVRFEPGIAEPFVETILRFEGNLDAVTAQGARVRSVMGNIATVDIPASKVAAVAALPASSRSKRRACSPGASTKACLPRAPIRCASARRRPGPPARART